MDLVFVGTENFLDVKSLEVEPFNLKANAKNMFH